MRVPYRLWHGRRGDRGGWPLAIPTAGQASRATPRNLERALGVKFMDHRGRQLASGGALRHLAHIDADGIDPRLRGVEVEVACDVDNPLTGPRGAAGGLGAGLMAFAGGRLRPGVDIVIDAIMLADRLKGCDLVVTGEGRMDGQAVFGKAPAGVARVARSLGIPVIAICGSLGEDAGKVAGVGIAACFSALEEPLGEADLGRRAAGMLERCARQVGGLIALFRPPAYLPDRV